MSKVFNLGFSKTGTTTLETALEILGYRVANGHWNKNYSFYLCALCIAKEYPEIIKFTDYFDAFCDGPWGGGTPLYKTLFEKIPDAKFLLSYRKPQEWYESFENQITLFDKNLGTAMSSYHANGMWGSAYWFRNIFGIKELEGNKQKIIDIYESYCHQVVDFFKKKGKDLLTIDVTENEDWAVLCRHLEKPIPKEPFPCANKTNSNWEKRKDNVLKQVQSAVFSQESQEVVAKWKHVLWVWRNITVKRNCQVALYGSGEHTRTLLRKLETNGLPRPKLIVETKPMVSELLGIPVRPVSEVSRSEFNMLVLSTEQFQAEMISIARDVFGDTLEILDLYEGV